MASFSRPAQALPARVMAAITDLITEARRADVPIVDVEIASRRLVESIPEAAALAPTVLRDEIVRQIAREPGLGVAFTGRAHDVQEEHRGS